MNRYRVRVAFPPRTNRRGFIVRAESAKEARNQIMAKGWIVRHVREEPEKARP